VCERFVLGEEVVADHGLECGIEALHAFCGAEVEFARDFFRLIVGDEFGDARGVDEEFDDWEDAGVRAWDEALTGDGVEGLGELFASVEALGGREEVEDALDAAGGVGGVEGAEDEVAGVGCFHGGCGAGGAAQPA